MHQEIYARVLVVDSDERTAALLMDEMREQGIATVTHTRAGLAVTSAVQRDQPDVVLYDHHFERPDDLLSCISIRRASPHARIVILAAAGPALKLARQWNAENPCIDAFVEKPLKPGQLARTVMEAAQAARAERERQALTNRLEQLLPTGAVEAVRSGTTDEQEMFEAAVLFTDLRHSSKLITSTAPREFFSLLNDTLSAQTRAIRSGQGTVVKYTGDGLMAIFRGMGRSHLAVRCGRALADLQLQSRLPFGIGIAEGLVLAGLVGDSLSQGLQRQYDVIGATVHLSARLCGLAEGGEVLATRAVVAASRLGVPLRDVGPVQVRGFPAAIDCVSIPGLEGPSNATAL
jgi:class 3 adenylate cyclase